MPETPDLREWLGDIDIYLLDQLLRGRVGPPMRVFDAGCGAGRNLLFFLRAGYDVAGVDRSQAAVAEVRRLAAIHAPTLDAGEFRVEPVERTSFGTGTFDLVISSAVLHFAADEPGFRAMLDEMWRLLRPQGILFARLASTIGMPMHRFTSRGGRRFVMPDASERFLVDEAFLLAETGRLAGTLIDPVKTTVVQDARCMTTWVLRRGSS